MFLVAALLMYGTMSGSTSPRFQAGKLAPIILGALALGFGILHFGPNLSAGWRSLFANATSIASPPPAPAAAPRPTVLGPAHAKSTKQSVPHWKTIVLGDSVLAPTGLPPVSANPVLPASTPPEVPEQASAIPSAKPSGAESSGDSPHDHGIKRAVKRVGHFLHINKGED